MAQDRRRRIDALRTSFMVEMGLTCMARSPGDDPTIVEAWL